MLLLSCLVMPEQEAMKVKAKPAYFPTVLAADTLLYPPLAVLPTFSLSSLFRTFTSSIVIGTSLLSISRILLPRTHDGVLRLRDPEAARS